MSSSVMAKALRLPVRVAVPPGVQGQPMISAGFRDMVKSALETSTEVYVCPLHEQRLFLDKIKNPTVTVLESIGVDCVIQTTMSKDGDKYTITFKATSRELPLLEKPIVEGTVSGSLDDLPGLAFKIASEVMNPWMVHLQHPTIVLGTNQKILHDYSIVLLFFEHRGHSHKLESAIRSLIAVHKSKKPGLREFQWITKFVVDRLKAFEDPAKKEAWFKSMWPGLKHLAGDRELAKPLLAEVLLTSGQVDNADALLREFQAYLGLTQKPVRFKIPGGFEVACEQVKPNVWTNNRIDDVIFVQKNKREILAVTAADGTIIWRYSLPRKSYAHFFGSTSKALYYQTLKDLFVFDKRTGKVLYHIELIGNPYKERWLGSGNLFVLNKEETDIFLHHKGVFQTREKRKVITTRDVCVIEHVDLKSSTSKILYKEIAPTLGIRYKLKNSVIMFSRNPGNGVFSWLKGYDISTAKEVEQPDGITPESFGLSISYDSRFDALVKVNRKFVGMKMYHDVTRLSDGKVIYKKLDMSVDEDLTYDKDSLYILQKNRDLVQIDIESGRIKYRTPIMDEYTRGFCKSGVLLYSVRKNTLWCPNVEMSPIDVRFKQKVLYLTALCRENQGLPAQSVAILDQLAPKASYNPDALLKSADLHLQNEDSKQAWFRLDSYTSAMEGYVGRGKEYSTRLGILKDVSSLKSKKNVDISITARGGSQELAKGSMTSGSLISSRPVVHSTFTSRAKRFDFSVNKEVTGIYSTQDCIFSFSGERFRAKQLDCLDKDTGKILWTHEFEGDNFVIGPQPSLRDNVLVWLGNSRRSEAMLNIAGKAAKQPVKSIPLPGERQLGISTTFLVNGNHAVVAQEEFIVVFDILEKTVKYRVPMKKCNIIDMDDKHLVVQGEAIKVFDLKSGNLIKECPAMNSGSAYRLKRVGDQVFLGWSSRINTPLPLSCFDMKRMEPVWKSQLPKDDECIWRCPVLADRNYLLFRRSFRAEFWVLDARTGKYLGRAKMPTPKNGALTDWDISQFLENGRNHKDGIDLVLEKKQVGFFMYRFPDLHSFLALCEFTPEPGAEMITFDNNPNFVLQGDAVVKKTVTKPHDSAVLVVAVGQGTLESIAKEVGGPPGLPGVIPGNACFGQRGKQQLIVDDMHNVYLITDGKVVCSVHETGKKVMALALNTTCFAYADLDKKVYIHDTKEGKLLTSTSVGAHVKSLAIAPDGKRIAVGTTRGTIHMYNFKGHELKKLSGHSFSVRHLTYLPDGKHLVSASDDLSIRVWNLDSGKATKQFTVHDTLIAGLALSDKTLYSADMNGTIHSWDIGTWKQHEPLQTNIESVSAFAVSPDGKTLVLGTRDGEIIKLTGPPSRR